jgi:hypothetical protein
MDFGKVALAAGAVVLLGVSALVTGIGRASPSAFKLVMENGFHSSTGPPDKFTLGFRHEGPFTASAPFCSAGYAVDLAFVPPMELRQFTCIDGSGSITARKFVVRANAQFTHEEGAWAIVEGTGRYSTLRGKGTSVLDTISGDPANHITTRYNETWVGVIDFDVTRPDVRISQASGKRLQRPRGSYSIRVAFSARDGSDGNAVSYAITVSGSGVFVHRKGTTTSGSVSMAFRVRPRKLARTLRLVLVASDPAGNETRIARQLRLSS